MKCDICGGTRAPSLITYTIYYDNKPVVIENVPAEVCQQCGEQYFAPETVEKLQKIVWSKKKPKRMVETPVYDLSLLPENESILAAGMT
jgi:YgiT-type zinc finger domain-containing protein